MSTRALQNARVRRVSAERRRIAPDKLALLIFLVLGAFLMAAPFYWMIITAFKPKTEVLLFPPTWWPNAPTLDAWRELTELRGGFHIFFRNSVFVSVTLTTLILLTSAVTGYVFAKFDFRGKHFLFVVVLSMMMIPFNVSLIPLYQLMANLKWTNTYWALIIPGIYNPFGIFLMRQFMHSIPDDLLDAARIDGASEWRIFVRIVLPLSTAALAALGIFTFMGAWDDFLWPLVILDDPALYTLPLGLSQLRGRFGSDVATMAAGATASVIPVLFVYLLAQRRFIEGIAMTGMKG